MDELFARLQFVKVEIEEDGQRKSYGRLTSLSCQILVVELKRHGFEIVRAVCNEHGQEKAARLHWEHQNGLLEADNARLRMIVNTAANNLDSVGARHYANWCRLQLEDKTEEDKPC